MINISVYSNKAVLEKLQKQFMSHLLGEKYSALTPNKAVEALIADWKTEYNEIIQEELEMLETDSDFGMRTMWDMDCNNAILFENEVLLQLKMEGDFYQGVLNYWETQPEGDFAGSAFHNRKKKMIND